MPGSRKCSTWNTLVRMELHVPREGFRRPANVQNRTFSTKEMPVNPSRASGSSGNLAAPAPRNVPRGTFLDLMREMFHVEHLPGEQPSSKRSTRMSGTLRWLPDSRKCSTWNIGRGAGPLLEALKPHDWDLRRADDAILAAHQAPENVPRGTFSGGLTGSNVPRGTFLGAANMQNPAFCPGKRVRFPPPFAGKHALWQV